MNVFHQDYSVIILTWTFLYGIVDWTYDAASA